jgi:hypothetical protein
MVLVGGVVRGYSMEERRWNIRECDTMVTKRPGEIEMLTCCSCTLQDFDHQAWP